MCAFGARNGFTLIELSVVVLMIGILAALFSTAFNNAKAKSQKVSCLNNLRRLQLAWVLYYDDNEDALPLNRSVDNPLPQPFFGRPNSLGSWVAGSPKADTTTDNISAGSLFQYAEKTVSTYHCPSDRSTVVNRPDVPRNRSYSMSAYMNGDDAGLDPRVKTKQSELLSPPTERIFVFIEEHEDSPRLGSFLVAPKERLSTASPTSWMSLPSDRHSQGCSLTFVDGHVEYWKWYWPKQADVQTKLTSNSHELRDLRRLQDAVPQP